MNLPCEVLEDFATTLYIAAGMRSDIAQSTARLQVLTDAIGRRTHGLAMLPLYVAQLKNGQMLGDGQPQVLRDGPVCSVWDGAYLPGLWLVEKAIKTLAAQAQQFGMAAIAIRRSHHIGCLAALAQRATEIGMVAQIYSSDPAGKRVAPFGGKQALFTPNPMAFAYPGKEHPVLVDICASVTSTSTTRQKFADGEQFEHAWLLDAQGQPTRDPAVLEHQQPAGSIQLLGGQEAGHKGFGLALMIEALSQGLSGHGRLDAPKQWGGNVFVQLIDPQAFAGAQAFLEQTDFLAKQCRSNPAIDPEQPVRLPGDQAAQCLAQARLQGLRYEASMLQALRDEAARLRVPCPDSLAA